MFKSVGKFFKKGLDFNRDYELKRQFKSVKKSLYDKLEEYVNMPLEERVNAQREDKVAKLIEDYAFMLKQWRRNVLYCDRIKKEI